MPPRKGCHLWLCAAMLVMGSALCVRSGARASEQPPARAARSLPRVDVPDTVAFRQTVDLDVDWLPTAEAVARLAEQCHVALEVAPSIAPSESRVTLRVHAVPLRSVLLGIAAASGPRFRWRMRGETAVLEQAPESQLPQEARASLAADARAGLVAAGLVGPSGKAPGSWRPKSPDVRAESTALISRLMELFPPDVLADPRTGGVRINALPGDLQELAYQVLVQGASRGAEDGIVWNTRALLENPLFTGREPTITLRWGAGSNQWLIDFGPSSGSLPPIPLMAGFYE